MKRTFLLGTAAAFMLSTGVAMAQSSTGTPSAQSGATQQQTQNQGSAIQQNADKQKQNPALAPNAVGNQAGMGDQAALEKMMGKDVYGAEGNKLGSIDDIILDPTSGKPQLAVIERGGVLGIGGKSIGLDYTLLGMEGDRLVAKQVTEDQVKAMPEFKQSDNMVSFSKDRGKNQGGQSQPMNQGGAGSGVTGAPPAGAPNSGATTGSTTPKQ